MPSERVQRQIDRLLDETEAALVKHDWTRVRTLAADVLRLDPDNADAREFLAAADRDGGASAAPPARQPAAAETPSAQAAPARPLPRSFANGRYTVRAISAESVELVETATGRTRIISLR